MDRRAFLSSLISAGALLALPSMAWAEPAKAERMLVMIHLAGGNDGLNTVVPYRDVRYKKLRPAIGLSAAELQPVNRDVALHHGLSALDPQQLCIVPGVGYAHPSLSHFRSTEIWATGSTEQSTQGWLGRWLDTQPARPFRAIGMGNRVPLALVGHQVLPITVGPFKRFALAHVPAGYDVPQPSPTLEAVRRRGAAAIKTAGRLAQLQPASQPAGAGLAADLRQVVALMEARLGAQVFHLTMDGFDTHCGQRPAHDQLVTALGAALAGFQRELAARGLAERTLTVVHSEFGRRVEENGSAGTDHGTAGPMLLMGPGVRPGVQGDMPSLSDLDDGNLRHTVNFPDVYAALLEDWLQSPSQAVLGATKPYRRCLQ